MEIYIRFSPEEYKRGADFHIPIWIGKTIYICGKRLTKKESQKLIEQGYRVDRGIQHNF